MKIVGQIKRVQTNAYHVNTDLAWVILQTTEANTKVLSLSIVVLGTATKQVACVFPFSVS